MTPEMSPEAGVVASFPASHEADLAILRRFEPVVRYTRGERFFPIDVERYISQCSLWVQRPNVPPEELVPQGKLTVEHLTRLPNDGFRSVHYLKLIEPLDLLELAKYSLNQAVQAFSHPDTADLFRAGRGRLVRVGYSSRLVDALFSITLFLRGRVPGDTAAAAALTYRQMQAGGERFCYYGRVVRESGWVAIQYWYFYPFNNWRSGFFGVNDHEGDWEMVTVYCAEEDDPSLDPDCRLKPHWVAYASHDFSGDDLRRRWDDPELSIVKDPEGGEHPVIYAGAGSHASYFSPGEYLAELELPFLSPLVRVAERFKRFWVNTLRQAGMQAEVSEFNVFKVPFVDYARGDGRAIGPRQDVSWEACLLDDRTKWATGYRGLWGLYVRDPISGENAPAGPVYNRDGSVRRCWYDPLGWAGLDKVPPPGEAEAFLDAQETRTRLRLEELREQIGELRSKLAGLGMEVAAIEGVAHLEAEHAQGLEQMAGLSQQMGLLRKDFTVEQAKLQAFEAYRSKIDGGPTGSLRGHIHRAHRPSSRVDLRLGRVAEGFAALSIGLTMVLIVLLIVFAREYLMFGLAALVGLVVFVEAGFRRRLSSLINSLVVGLALVSAAVLVFEFFWQLIVVIVLAAGVYIMWENLREIRA